VIGLVNSMGVNAVNVRNRNVKCNSVRTVQTRLFFDAQDEGVARTEFLFSRFNSCFYVGFSVVSVGSHHSSK
jgi:hypothetical protein